MYNAAETISQTIESVLCQSYKHFELILINDGSTDNTLQEIGRLSDSRIKVISQQNQGVAIARNSGIEISSGDYIAFLDADDLWDANKLNQSVTFLEKYEYDLIYTDIWMFNEKIENAIPYKYSEPFLVEDDYQRLLIFDYIPTLTVLLKKEVLRVTGFFDSFLNGTEDWDLWIRIANEFKIGYLDQRLSYYRNSENGLSKNRDRHLQEERKVLDKHQLTSNVKSQSEWVWNRKNFHNEIQQRRFLKATKFYIRMLFLFPFKQENYRF